MLVAEILSYLIAAQQTLTILLVAPAFAAGAITDEQRRGSLDFLLITPLPSAQIVLGKWLGQATRVLHLSSNESIFHAPLFSRKSAGDNRFGRRRLFADFASFSHLAFFLFF